MKSIPSFVSQTAYEERLECIKNGLHRHLCSECGTLWQHVGEEISNRHLAHCCPNCGNYIIDIFFNASDLTAIEWDGKKESSKAKLYDLKRREEFEQTKIRRIYFRVYWLTKKK